MRDFTQSVCWWVLPLIAGLGIGYALGGGKADAEVATLDTQANTNDRGSADSAAAAVKSRPELPPPAETQVPAPPANLDELLQLAKRAGNHYRIAHATLGHALTEVPDEQIVAWFHGLLTLEKRRRPGEYQMVENHSMTAVSEQLVRRLPELALEELAKGRRELAAVLAATYPERIPEFLQGIGNPEHRSSMLYEHLLSIDSHAARRAYIEQHGNADDLQHFDQQLGPELNHVAIHSTSHTPHSLLEALRQEGAPAHSLSAAASKLAHSFQSPQAAIDFAAANKVDELSYQARHRFYGDVLSTFARDDPQAAGAWLNTLPQESIPKILQVSLGSMGWSAAEEAKELIATIDPSLLPRNGLQAIARGLAAPGSGALDWYLSKSDNGADRQGLMNVLQSTVGRDPEAVLDYLSANPDLLNREAQISAGLAGHIVRNDPASAALLLGKLEGAESIEASGSAIGRNWARVDAAAARAHLDTLSDPAVREAFIAGVASADAGWRETLDWASRLDGRERDRGLALALKKAKHDPLTSAAVASEWLNDAPPGDGQLPDMTRNAITNVGNVLAETAPDQAGDWATGLPEGAAREQAIATVSEKWSSFDPAGTSEWLVELPPSAARDTAIGNLVTNINDDPVGAFSWSLVVSDPDKRGELLHGVVKSWRHRDPQAAREAIESADELSAAEREQLLQQVDDAR